MSQASTPLETTRGYAPPIVTQFSVFLPNKVGKLLDMVEGFEGSAVAICAIHLHEASDCAINVHEASDCAIVRVITNNSSAARQLLRSEKLAFTETDILVVELSEGN